MNPRKPSTLSMLPVLATLALLAACGGGNGGSGGNGGNGDDGGMRPGTLSSDATAPPEAFTRFAAAQADDDLGEPIVVEGVTPPTSETAEPLPVTR